MSKVVLITGAARGIGAATARLAAQRGYCELPPQPGSRERTGRRDPA